VLLELSARTATEWVRIPLAEGELEGVLSYPETSEATAAVVIAGPHPLLAGDMDNNVVTALAEHLAATGYATLRFNYQGVGQSTGARLTDPKPLGEFWRTSRLPDEPQRWIDLAAAVGWLRSVTPPRSPLAVVGYSFGCYVAASWLAAGGAADALGLIAPTVTHHDYAPLANCATPKLALASRTDFATSEAELVAAVDGWSGPKQLILAELDDHFFRGCEGWVNAHLSTFLEQVFFGDGFINENSAGSVGSALRGGSTGNAPRGGSTSAGNALRGVPGATSQHRYPLHGTPQRAFPTDGTPSAKGGSSTRAFPTDNETERPGTAIDEHLQSLLDLHLHPLHGSSFWLARQARLGFDVRDRVRSSSDLHLLGTIDPADLQGTSVWRMVPRAFHAHRRRFVVAETGGTHGAPVASAYLPDEFQRAFVEPFVEVAQRSGFPQGETWLFLGPSGPHIIGRAVRHLARRLDSPEPWYVDFDPRWAKKLASGSLAARRYLEHVVEQARQCLAREEISVLFATPPVLDGLAQRMSDAERERIRGVHYGGLPVHAARLNALREIFPHAVHLSGYGNTLFGCAMEVEDVDRRAIDYFPFGERLRFDVAPAEACVGRDDCDEPASRGQLMFHRFDRSMLLVNVLERDWAELVGPSDAARRAGCRGAGIRDPRPAQKQSGLKLGLY